jgi:rhodanese-related sulfurtransferase
MPASSEKINPNLSVGPRNYLSLAIDPDFNSNLISFFIKNMLDLTVEELKARMDNGEKLHLLDVREPSEFAAGHLEGAQNIPLRNLRQALPTLAHLKNAEIICICRSGPRSSAAARILQENGFHQAHNLSGGMLAWSEKINPNLSVGLPRISYLWLLILILTITLLAFLLKKYV